MYCIWKKVQTVSSISNVIIFSSFLGKLYFDCIMSEEDFLDSAKETTMYYMREKEVSSLLALICGLEITPLNRPFV